MEEEGEGGGGGWLAAAAGAAACCKREAECCSARVCVSAAAKEHAAARCPLVVVGALFLHWQIVTPVASRVDVRSRQLSHRCGCACGLKENAGVTSVPISSRGALQAAHACEYL